MCASIQLLFHYIYHLVQMCSSELWSRCALYYHVNDEIISCCTIPATTALYNVYGLRGWETIHIVLLSLTINSLFLSSSPPRHSFLHNSVEAGMWRTDQEEDEDRFLNRLKRLTWRLGHQTLESLAYPFTSCFSSSRIKFNLNFKASTFFRSCGWSFPRWSPSPDTFIENALDL